MIIIGNYPQFAPMAIQCPVVESPAVGWDILREVLWVPQRNLFPKGTPRATEAGVEGVFFVQDEKQIGTRAGRRIIELTSYGIQAEKGYKADSTASTVVTYGYDNHGSNRHPGKLLWPTVTLQWISPTPLNALQRVAFPQEPAEPMSMGIWGPYNWETGIWWNPWTSTASVGTANGWYIERTEQSKLIGCDYTLITDYYLLDWAPNT